MKLKDAVDLIKSDRITMQSNQLWADLGSGSGLFSRALLQLLPTGSTVYAVDRQEQHFTEESIRFIKADLEGNLLLPTLDGIVMANSLHFIKEKLTFLKSIRKYLKPSALFILVEYNTNRSNRYVPYPIDDNRAKELFHDAGFIGFETIASRPSIYGRADIYSAHCSNVSA